MQDVQIRFHNRGIMCADGSGIKSHHSITKSSQICFAVILGHLFGNELSPTNTAILFFFLFFVVIAIVPRLFAEIGEGVGLHPEQTPLIGGQRQRPAVIIHMLDILLIND